MRMSEAEYQRWQMQRGNGVGADALGTLPPMSEKQLQAQMMAVAARLGMLSYHTYSSKRSAPGFPDLALVRPADAEGTETTLFLLELKIDGAHPTLAQQRWLDALANVTKVVAGVVQPSTLAAWVRRIQEEG